MTRYYILFAIITVSSCEGTKDSTICDGFQANFTLKGVAGSWYTVAIIPENLFPEKHITCYRMEISETDEGSLKWLINKTIDTPPNTTLSNENRDTIVRQRYFTEAPFDVWSKSINGIRGCFQQVISLDISKKDVHKALKHDAMMQLHLLETSDGSGPYLLQMLWGRMITAVIYRRTQGVSQDQLKPVFEVMNHLRGPQRLPKICDSPLRDLLVF